MTRGRKYVPSSAEHGIWFQHSKPSEKEAHASPETITGIMLESVKNIGSNSHIKRPRVFEKRIQLPYKQGNPFSDHDNRNCFLSQGIYFHEGLGKHRVVTEASQHSSTDLVTWGRKKASEHQYSKNSLYREDFCGFNGPRKQVSYRRFSKHYQQRSQGLVPLSSSTTVWEPNDDCARHSFLQTLANTQPIITGPNTWKYSYHYHSFANKKKKENLPLIS